MDAAELLTQNVDKSKLPPLHQKRILAFVNHFLISSCGFLNDFALQCEAKFIELERKLQKVEAALTILESKLASIPDVESTPTKTDFVAAAPQVHDSNSETNTEANAHEVPQEEDAPTPKGTLVTEHSAYKKFFKMLQVGVPMQAVKIKMQSEGVDPDILDNPQALLPDETDNAASES